MIKGSSAIIIHNKKILLFLRDDIDSIPHPNKWSLPGGQVEEGESFLEGLKRELVEEISYAPKNIHFLGQQIYDNGNHVHLYLAFLGDDEVKHIKHNDDEGQGIEFFSLEEFSSIKTTPILEKYSKEYLKVIEKILNNNYIPKAHELDMFE